MIVAITGHRPEDLPNPIWVVEALTEVLLEKQPELLIQGMAAGADLMSAKVAHRLGIPFIGAKPWKGHTSRVEDAKVYDWALKNATEIINVSESEEYEGPWVYHNRNHFMVDKADLVIAIWSGKDKGGTAETVKYAYKVNKPVLQINPLLQEVIAPKPTLF